MVCYARVMSIFKGMLFGAVNVVVIAVALALMEHEAVAGMIVVMICGVPGVALGGLLGLIARQLAARPPALRVLVLALPAFGLVALLGATFDYRATVPLACIPTLVAALLLERSTRLVVAPAIPVASALPGRSAP